MGWRTVVITNPARLKIRNSQLLVMQDSDIPIPLEDINSIYLETPEVLLNSAVLSRIAQHGISLIVSDEKHMPCFFGSAFDSHSRLFGMQRTQLAMTEPFNKRCWQLIVQQKIANQAECLRILGRQDYASIVDLIPLVASGDAKNIEAIAARNYFEILFGDDFARGDDHAVNSALNYGYAIMRSAMARSLSNSGFLLSHGIHHRSELNAYNLADDFMEPFRPLVDLFVASSMTIRDEFEREHRQSLVGLLACEIMVDSKRYNVSTVMDLYAASFGSACREKKHMLLKLPQLIPITKHSYE